MIEQGELAYVVMDNFEKYLERWYKALREGVVKRAEKIKKAKKAESK